MKQVATQGGDVMPWPSTALAEGIEPATDEVLVSAWQKAHRNLEHAAMRVLAQATTMAEAAPRILQTVCRSLGWDVGAIWNVDPDSNLLRCVNVWRMPCSEAKEFELATRQGTF